MKYEVHLSSEHYYNIVDLGLELLRSKLVKAKEKKKIRRSILAFGICVSNHSNDEKIIETLEYNNYIKLKSRIKKVKPYI